ncbi:MAG: septum formation initiator family protein [Butyricicoccus sp.]|nr:septum formation initiator family protein [Butyricicoccus sp.]
MKKKMRTPRVVKIAVACVAVFFVVSLIHQQMQISDRQARLDRIKDEVAEQQAANDALRDQVENGVSDDYIASIAREHGYVMPNERVFKDASSK